MKKFGVFLNRLKPYKRLYKIFWMILIIAILLIFQIFMLTIAHAVPHNNNPFSYWFKGLYFLLVTSRSEPNSAQGFIFATAILGSIPTILILPILYFTFTNWLIFEKLSDKFVEVPKDKYIKWANFFHYSILATTFIIIPGLLSYLGGGGILPHQTYHAALGAFNESFKLRVAGVSAFLYYGIGCIFTTIVVIWGIAMIINWIWLKIVTFFSKIAEERRKRREEHLTQKRALKVKKSDKSNINETSVNNYSGDTTVFDSGDDF